MGTSIAAEQQTIFIIGANGRTGRQCVNLALQTGHRVIALVRNPSKLDIIHANLQIVKGDVLVSATYEKFLQAGQVVISAIGVSTTMLDDRPTKLYSQGNAELMKAMTRKGVRRWFVISASAVEISPMLPVLARLAAKYVVGRLLRHMYADLLRMETLVKQSNTDWTIMRPPRLTGKQLTGHYRIAANRFLKNSLKISRADLAHFMLKNIYNQDTYRTTVEIGY